MCVRVCVCGERVNVLSDASVLSHDQLHRSVDRRASRAPERDRRVHRGVFML